MTSDLASNAQVKVIESLEQGQRDIGFWHLQNASDFMRISYDLKEAYNYVLVHHRIQDTISGSIIQITGDSFQPE
jgi:hypothetical protein